MSFETTVEMIKENDIEKKEKGKKIILKEAFDWNILKINKFDIWRRVEKNN